MSPLEEYLALLEPLRQRQERAGIFSDFDGTLAEIVDDPAQARPLHGIPGVLDRLSRRYGRVGVISGRPVAFLRSVLGGDDLPIAVLAGHEKKVRHDRAGALAEQRQRPALPVAKEVYRKSPGHRAQTRGLPRVPAH